MEDFGTLGGSDERFLKKRAGTEALENKMTDSFLNSFCRVTFVPKQ